MPGLWPPGWPRAHPLPRGDSEGHQRWHGSDPGRRLKIERNASNTCFVSEDQKRESERSPRRELRTFRENRHHELRAGQAVAPARRGASFGVEGKGNSTRDDRVKSRDRAQGWMYVNLWGGCLMVEQVMPGLYRIEVPLTGIRYARLMPMSWLAPLAAY